MKQLLQLVKVQFSTLFSPPKNSKKKTQVLYVFQPVLFLAFAYFYTDMLYETLLTGDKELTIYIMAAVSFILAFATTLMMAQGYLLKFKDFDLLMSLPIKKEKIFIAKIGTFFVFQLVTSIILILPAIFIYGIKESQEIMFYVASLIGAIPMLLIPTTIGTAIILLIQKIPGFSRYPNLLRNVLTLGLVGVSMSISLTLSSASDNILNMGAILKDLANNLRMVAFPAFIYSDAVLQTNLLYLLALIAVAIVLIAIMVMVLSKTFVDTNGEITTGIKSKNFKLKNQKQSSVLLALFKKESKTYFTNFMYVLNSSVGLIIMVGGLGYLLWMSVQDPEISMIANVMKQDSSIRNIAYMLMCTVIGSLGFLTFTSNVSISLEGKQFWIVKSAPVSAWEVFGVKALLNALIIFVPTTIITVGIALFLSFSPVWIILAIIVLAIHALTVGYLGVAINITFPKLEFNREIEVIKQSLSVIVSLGLGMALIFLHGFIMLNVEAGGMITGVLVYGGLNLLYLILTLTYLHFIGCRKYIELSN